MRVMKVMRGIAARVVAERDPWHDGPEERGGRGGAPEPQLMKEPGAQALSLTQVCDTMLSFMVWPLVNRLRVRSST